MMRGIPKPPLVVAIIVALSASPAVNYCAAASRSPSLLHHRHTLSSKGRLDPLQLQQKHQKRNDGFHHSSVKLVTSLARGGASPSSPSVISKSKSNEAATATTQSSIIWEVPALSCAASYALYNVNIYQKGSASIHPILGCVILQLVAALFGTGLLTALLVSGDKTFELHYDKDGIYYCCLAGIAIGTAEMLSFCVSGLGVPATQSIPVIIGGSVLFGAVLGLIMLKETLMLHGWTGVGMLVTGIACVALDPGKKMVEGGGGSVVGVEGQPPIYWRIIAMICANSYALYNIYIKKGSASINPILGGVILQFVAAAFGILLLGCIIAKDGGTSNLHYDRLGLIWSCAAGLAVGTAEMLSFCVSGMGVPVTQSIPVIIGGSVLFGAVLGLIMLGETLMFNGWLGVVLLTIGITIVATDPGEKAPGH